MKKRISVLLIVTLMFSFCACGTDDITDQVANVVQAEDEHILAVKGGSPSAYPSKKFGEAFDDFFGSPTWKYFEGTKEGTDEDGDGEPDTVEENVDVVEFTGYCTYQDVRVKALIQFTLSKDDDTFEATYLSFNDVPQNMLMLAGLLEAVFSDEDTEDVPVEDVTMEDTPAEDTSDNMSQENEDPLLEEFIALVCSYADPPDLENDALREYFQEEYDNWASGESYRNIIVGSDGHLIIPDHTAEYAGTWWDEYSQRCYMEIRCDDGINYSIDINWGSSAWENTHWSFYGTYDEVDGGIHYYGSRIEEVYSEGGEVQETYSYTDGEGLIWLGDDGMLYWEDYTEQQGEDCVFARSEG